MHALTERQRFVLQLIEQSIRERGYPPTVREIARTMGISSSNGVTDHLRALIRKGALVREASTARGLRPTRMPESAEPPEAGTATDRTDRTDRTGLITVPVVSRIEHGRPLIDEAFQIDTVEVDSSMLDGATDVFGLQMHGDALVDAGITEGDYIFVRRQMSAQNGDLVVMLVGDEAIVRRLLRTPTQVCLKPANTTMATIFLRADDVQPHMIIGVAVGIFRQIRAPS